MEFIYVTGNKAKISSAKQYLEPLGVTVNHEKMDTPELQADNVEDIAKYSAKYACNILNKRVIKNDTGFYVEALKGFPAAYSHYAEETLGRDGLLKLMEGVTNRKAKFIECFALCEPNEEPITFFSITNGRIATDDEIYGSAEWGWDSIFIPDGKDKPFAYYPDDVRHMLWDTSAYDEIFKYLKTKKD